MAARMQEQAKSDAISGNAVEELRTRLTEALDLADKAGLKMTGIRIASAIDSLPGADT